MYVLLLGEIEYAIRDEATGGARSFKEESKLSRTDADRVVGSIRNLFALWYGAIN